MKIPTSAPRRATGSERMTPSGTVQLSYCATRNRYPNRTAIAMMIPVCPPASRYWNDIPDHSYEYPSGNSAASRSTASMPSPDEKPGLVIAVIPALGNRL